MISFFQKFIKTWAFGALMGLLILSFAVFGMNDVFKSVTPDKVITTSSRTVSATEYRTMLDQVKENYTQRSGRSITYEEIVDQGQHQVLLEQLADKAAMGAWLAKMQLSPSPKMVVAEIAKIQAFFNPATGQFDKDLYAQKIAELKTTKERFEEDLTDQIASNHFVSAATAGMKTPRIYATLEAAARQQSRDIEYFVINPGSVEKPAPATEAELKTFYTANAKRFEDPELRQVRLIRFVAEEFKTNIAIDEEALKKMYDFRLESLSVPETRTFVTISAPNEKAANAIAQALKNGDTPDTAAKANKGNVIVYDRKAKLAVPDAKIADAAFAMKSGEISGPVKGTLGLAIIKMDYMYPGQTPTLEQVRPQLEEEYRDTKAKQRLTEITEAYQEGRDKGEKFEALAQKLGVKVYDLPPVFADGRTLDQNLNLQQFPEVLKMTYALPEGGESDVESMGKGQFFALKVVKVKPAGLVPFEAVKPQLEQLYLQQTWTKAVREKVDQANARLNKGEDLAEVAKAYGASLVTLKAVDQLTGPQKLGEPVVGSIFTAKLNKPFVANPDPAQFLIGRVTVISQGQASDANALTAVLSRSVSERVTSDLGAGISAEARKAVRLKTYPDMAQQALGVKKPTAADKQKSSSSK